MKIALISASLLLTSAFASARTIQYDITIFGPYETFSASWDNPNGFIPANQAVGLASGQWTSCSTPAEFSCSIVSFHPTNSPPQFPANDYVQIDFAGPNGGGELGFVDGEFVTGALQNVGFYQDSRFGFPPATLDVSDISTPEPNTACLFGIAALIFLSFVLLLRQMSIESAGLYIS